MHTSPIRPSLFTPLFSPLLALPLAILAGCGDSSESTTTQPQSTPQPTLGSQSSELVIRRVDTDVAGPHAELGQEAADALAEEFGNSLQAAFDEQAKIQAQGGTPEQIQAAHARFDAVQPTTQEDLQAMWMAPDGIDQMPLGEAIGALLEGSGVEVNPGKLAEHWEEMCPVSVDGMARAQSIETIAAHFGMTAAFPNPNPWNQETPILEFDEGSPDRPVAHSGPFRIQTTQTEEYAPYGVGKVSARAHAIGLPDSVLGCNAAVSEWFSIDGATNAEGTSLLAQEDVTRLTQSNQNERIFSVDTSVELAGLVRSVEAIQSFHGKVILQMPVDVHEATFSTNGPSKQTIAGMELHMKRVGTDNQIEIQIGEAGNYEILWAPMFADGSAMGIANSSSYEFNGVLTSTIQTPEKPGKIRIKLIRTTPLEFPFVLSKIPMEGFADQPESLPELEYEAAQPVSVVFSEFISREGDFPKISLRSVNHSNKDIKSIQAKLIYLGADNKPVGDCFTTLISTSFEEGLPVYIKANDANTMEQTAFFMPKETDTIQVSVQKVEFMDYSTWEAPE